VAAPATNCRRVKYRDFEVISEERMSSGFFISIVFPTRYPLQCQIQELPRSDEPHPIVLHPWLDCGRTLRARTLPDRESV
jgi:hypothetical protein